MSALDETQLLVGLTPTEPRGSEAPETPLLFGSPLSASVVPETCLGSDSYLGGTSATPLLFDSPLERLPDFAPVQPSRPRKRKGLEPCSDTEPSAKRNRRLSIGERVSDGLHLLERVQGITEGPPSRWYASAIGQDPWRLQRIGKGTNAIVAAVPFEGADLAVRVTASIDHHGADVDPASIIGEVTSAAALEGNCPHFVHCYGSVRASYGKEKVVVEVLERIDGTLHDLEPHLDETSVMRFLAQVVCASAYLAKENIAHNDLHRKNVAWLAVDDEFVQCPLPGGGFAVVPTDGRLAVLLDWDFGTASWLGLQGAHGVHLGTLEKVHKKHCLAQADLPHLLRDLYTIACTAKDLSRSGGARRPALCAWARSVHAAIDARRGQECGPSAAADLIASTLSYGMMASVLERHASV